MDPTDMDGIQSLMMVAVKSDPEPMEDEADPELALLLNNDVTNLVSRDFPILTDEFAPVDYYTNKAIK